MKKEEIKLDMEVGFKSDTEKYGRVIKIKGFEAIVEVWDGEYDDVVEYTVSIERLEKV